MESSRDMVICAPANPPTNNAPNLNGRTPALGTNCGDVISLLSFGIVWAVGTHAPSNSATLLPEFTTLLREQRLAHDQGCREPPGSSICKSSCVHKAPHNCYAEP